MLGSADALICLIIRERKLCSVYDFFLLSIYIHMYNKFSSLISMARSSQLSCMMSNATGKHSPFGFNLFHQFLYVFFLFTMH